MSDTEPCPPVDPYEAAGVYDHHGWYEQLALPFPDEPPWSELEEQRLSLPNPPGVPCFCNSECHLNSHRKP